MLAEYYRDRYQFCWRQKITTESIIISVGVIRVIHIAGISSVGVSSELQSQVLVLLVLSKYYRVSNVFCWCQQSTSKTGISSVGVSKVLQSPVAVLLLSAEYVRVKYQFCWC